MRARDLGPDSWRRAPPGDMAAVDPFADLLLALSAMVIPVILVLLPAVGAAGRAEPTAVAPAVTVAGRPAATLVAGASGLVLCGADGGFRGIVALEAVAEDAPLRGWLAGVRRAGDPLLVVVRPDGLESAFAIEPILAAAGPERVEQVRLRASASMLHLGCAP